MRGGIVDNQSKRFIAVCQRNFIGEYLAQLRAIKVDCVMHFFRRLAVTWPGAQSARDNHLLASNLAKYSPILIFFHRQTQWRCRWTGLFHPTSARGRS